MQESYKRILEKRRTQIVEQIRWSRELAAGLEKYGLLSKEDLRYVEVRFSLSFYLHLAGDVMCFYPPPSCVVQIINISCLSRDTGYCVVYKLKRHIGLWSK